MGLFGKRDKKETRLIDEFGELTEPMETNSEYEKNHFVEEVYGRNASNRKRQSMMTKVVIYGVSALTVFALVSGPVSMVTASKTKDLTTSLATPAFKTRYEDLGASIIRDYYAHKQPTVNLTSQVHWGGVSVSGGGIQQGKTSKTGDTGESDPDLGLADPSLNRVGGDSSSTPSQQQGGTQSAPVEVTGISYIGGKQVDFITSKDDSTNIEKTKKFTNPKLETLSYSGVIDGNIYTFTVSLIIPDVNSPEIRPYLANDPTMTYYAPITSIDLQKGQVPSSSDQGTYQPVELSDTAVETIDNWAVAYAGNDQAALKRLSGDTDPQTVYHGLGGYSVVGRTNIVWSYTVDTGNDKDVTVARISYQMRSSNNSLSSSSSSKNGKNTPFAPTQYMDILIRGAGKGIPTIEAWAPAGQWKELRSGLNAITVDPNGSSPGTTQGNTTTSSTTTTSSSSAGTGSATSSTPRSTTGSKNGSTSSTKKSTSSSTGDKTTSPTVEDKRDNS